MTQSDLSVIIKYNLRLRTTILMHIQCVTYQVYIGKSLMRSASLVSPICSNLSCE